MQSMEGIQKDRYSRAQESSRSLHLSPHFEDFHVLSVSEDYTYPLHQHQNYEAILVSRGPYRCSLNDQQLEIEHHQVLIIKPGDWHQDLLHVGQEHFVLHFHLVGSAADMDQSLSLFRDGVEPVDQICKGTFQREAALFKELADEARKGQPFASHIQDHFLGALFWRFVRQLPENALSSRFRRLSEDRDFAYRIEMLFEKEKKRMLSVDEMAQSLGISRRTLTMKCRNLFGHSPADLFNRFKVARAEQWLVNTEAPVKAVAYQLGFANPFHFSRVFKKVRGYPPSEVKK